MSRPIITLLTDFGLRDAYVGTMKGVILARAPEVELVDLTHDVAPQSVAEARFLLTASAPYFPAGTIHVAVVDPGVGSDRDILAVRSRDQLFLAPDNGLLSDQIRAASETRRVIQSRFFAPRVSRTFHGRDIFAPLAAALASGVGLEELGPPAHSPQLVSWPDVKRSAGALEGEILYVDRFGNLITNICEEDCGRAKSVSIEGRCLGPPRESYVEAAPDALLAIVGSFGYLEVAMRGGHAARELRIGVGAKVVVSLGEPGLFMKPTAAGPNRP